MIKTYQDAVEEIYLSAKDKDCKITREYLIEVCKLAMIRDGHLYVGMSDREFIESILTTIKDNEKILENETNPEELCNCYKLSISILKQNIEIFLREKIDEENEKMDLILKGEKQ